MDKLITEKSQLPQEQQQAIEERLHELNNKALLLLEQMPESFEDYVEKALKECNDTMREMIEKSSDVCNDKNALSYIFVIHKERKKDLERLKDTFMQPQQEQTAEPEQKPKGRPQKTFKDCLNGQTEKEKEERLRRLHNVIDGKKGKYVSLYILTAIELGWIEKPTATQVENEFGDIGNKSGYNAYLHKNKFSDEEINGAIESLK